MFDPKTADSDIVSLGETAYYNVRVVGSGHHSPWHFNIASGKNLPSGYFTTFTPSSTNRPREQ